jgi:hypothetical protein
MSNASGLAGLGQALDEYLVSEYTPPANTQTALAFLAGVGVDPGAFRVDGVVNPLRVNEFVNIVANQVAPVADGRFAGSMLPANQLYAALLALSIPVDAAGTPQADAFGSLKAMAGAAFGTLGAQAVTTAPATWYDGGGGWSTYTTSTASSSGSSESSTAGETPPAPPVTPRFERLWRWRTLDPGALADVVVPAAETPAAQEPAPVVRDHRVVVRDHRLNPRMAQLREPAMLRAEPMVATPLMAAVPRLQLASLVDARPVLASGRAPAIVSQEVVQLLEEKAPVLQAEIQGNGESATTQSVDSDDLTLTLDYCIVQLSRDAWWNDVLVRMPGWYAPGMQAGDIVPTRGLAGQPVGVPIAMVVTRNVQVSGHWSEADRSAAETHTSFGPWHIGETSLVTDQATSSASLSIPGMQVIAVICSLLPQMPPMSDPRLAAAPAAA